MSKNQKPKDRKTPPTGHDKTKAATSFTQKLTEPYKLPKKIGLMARLRNYFLTGLIVVGPLFITIYAVWTFVTWVDALVKPYLPDLPAFLKEYNPQNYIPFVIPEIPGIGLIFAVLVLILAGAFMANLFGQTILSYGEMMLGRMPIVRNVYQALKQIFETVLSQSNNSFQKIGLIEYPRRGIYSIVFISKETEGEISNRYKEEYHTADDNLISVFLPTTPNPTSGYLLFVPCKDVKILDMSVEEGAKMVISAGLIEPGVDNEKNESAREGITTNMANASYEKASDQAKTFIKPETAKSTADSQPKDPTYPADLSS